MQPLHDSSGVSSSLGSHTLTWNHTIGNHQNRILMVFVFAYANVFDASTCTFNGVPMTLVGGGGDGAGTQTWVMVDPPIGTFEVSIYSGSVQEWISMSESFYDIQGYDYYGTYDGGGSSYPQINLSGYVGSADVVCYNMGSYSGSAVTTNGTLLQSLIITDIVMANGMGVGLTFPQFQPALAGWVCSAIVMKGTPLPDNSNELSMYFGPSIPLSVESIGIAFITGPTLKANNSISTLNAERYAPENYPNLATLNVFGQGVAGSILNVTFNVPGTTYNGLVSGFGNWSLSGPVQLTGVNWGFNVLNTPIEVSGIHVTPANTWYPTIQPGTVYRFYTVPSYEPANSWLTRSGLVAGDQVWLIYSVPEMQYEYTADVDATFPASPARYKTLKQVVSPISASTFSFRGSIYELDQVLINGVDRSHGALPWNNVGTNAYVASINNTLKTVQLNDNLQADDYIQITYKTYNDFYEYTGYRDYSGTWYSFDANPEYGHYIANDQNTFLLSSSVALGNNCMIYAIPSAYITTNYQPTTPPTTINLGTLNMSIVRAVDWGELYFIMHCIAGDGLVENLVITQGSPNSTWGHAQFSRNYYDQQGQYANIYSTSYPSMLPLGNVLLSAPAGLGSVIVADIRQRGGGIPPNFPLASVVTEQGVQLVSSFYDLGLWLGTPVTQGGVAQININTAILTTDPNNTNPALFTATEINQIVQSQITPGIDFNIVYVDMS